MQAVAPYIKKLQNLCDDGQIERTTPKVRYAMRIVFAVYGAVDATFSDIHGYGVENIIGVEVSKKLKKVSKKL